MARKSNKTAHVLGLITNEKKEAPANAEALEPSSEEIVAPDTTGTPTNSNKVNASIPILEIASGGSSHISDAIRQNLIQEVFPDDPEFSLNTEDSPHSEAELETTEQATSLEAPSDASAQQEQNQTIPQENLGTNVPQLDLDSDISDLEVTSSKAETPQDLKEVSQPLDVTPSNISDMVDVASAKSNKKVSVVSDFQPLDFSKKENQPLENLLKNPDFKYFYVNVAEKAVTEKVLEYMKRFNMCTCDRCVVDTIALALTYLPSKYIVTHKENSYALINYYTMKYNIQIISELTKACMVVSQNPHHDRKL